MGGVVVGATGNLGASVLGSLENAERVESVLGLERRLPNLTVPKVRWTSAVSVTSAMVSEIRGDCAVVSL